MLKNILIIWALCVTASFADFPLHTNTGNFNATTNATGDFNAFSWQWMGYDSQAINVNLLPAGYASVSMRLSYPRRGTIFLDIGGTLNVSNFTASIDRTNLPPDGVYFCEFLGYNTSITNMDTRSLATGMVNIQHSLFQNTTQSSWTNPAVGTVIGPPYHTLSPLGNWPFLTSSYVPVDPVALTGGVGNGATVTVTGKTFYVTVVAPTGTAASVDADLQDHKTNATAHASLFALDNLTNILGGVYGTPDLSFTNLYYLASNPSNYCTLTAASNLFNGAVSTNDPHYLASLTNESDTLATVMARGVETGTNVLILTATTKNLSIHTDGSATDTDTDTNRLTLAAYGAASDLPERGASLSIRGNEYSGTTGGSVWLNAGTVTGEAAGAIYFVTEGNTTKINKSGDWNLYGKSISNAVFYGDGAGLTGITAGQVGALETNASASTLSGYSTGVPVVATNAALAVWAASNTVGNIVRLGAVTNAPFSGIFNPVSLLPFVSATTCTLTYAMVYTNSSWFINPTGTFYATADTTLTDTNIEAGFTVNLFYNGQTFGFVGATMTNTATLTSNAWNNIIFWKGYGSSKFIGK